MVWDSEGEPHKNFDFTASWTSMVHDETRGLFSIPRIVDENATSLRARYLAWIYELGCTHVRHGRSLAETLQLRPGFSYWWMTLPASISFGGTTAVYTAVRLMALEDLVKQLGIRSIELHSGDLVLTKVITSWCNNAGIVIQCNRVRTITSTKKPHGIMLRLFRLLPMVVRGLLYLIYYSVERWPLRHQASVTQMTKSNSLFFVDYLIHLDQKSIRNGEFGSSYWTKLVSRLKNNCSEVTWAHHYLKHSDVPSTKVAAQLLDSWNKSFATEQHHLTPDAMLGARVLWRTLKDFVRLNWMSRRLVNQVIHLLPHESHLNFAPLFQKEWMTNLRGVSGMWNCLILNLFERLLSSIPRQRIGIYLLENQPWEMAFIHSWRSSGHGQLIGVQHATVLEWDTRYFFDPRTYLSPSATALPRPDLVVVNSKIALRRYCEGGYPRNELREVEALRYLYLIKVVASEANLSQAPSPLRVLVITDYFPNITRHQLAILVDASRFMPLDTQYIVKSHPSCPVVATDYPTIHLRVVDEQLSELWNKCDVAFTSNPTSAAVEAYAVGLPVITVVNGNCFNLSPLRGEEGIQFVTNGSELAASLLKMVPDRGAPRDSLFCVDSLLPRWGKLLEFDSLSSRVEL